MVRRRSTTVDLEHVCLARQIGREMALCGKKGAALLANNEYALVGNQERCSGVEEYARNR